jgi:dihydroneopterin aldolase
MALVALENMQFHAHHGVYDAEQIVGNTYVVSVYVRTAIVKAALSDNLAEAINYESIFHLCQKEMEVPRKLLESVVVSIAMRMKHQFQNMQGLRVRVQKMNPPVGGQVESSWVEEEWKFDTNCPRCKRGMICYGDDSCWCNNIGNIFPATRETMIRQFGTSCLCSECLKIYAGIKEG